MMHLIATISLTLLAVQAQPDPAVEAKVEKSTDTAKAEKDDKDKIICKRTEVIGSKFKKRICGTKEQWETLHKRGEDTTREMQRRKGVEPVT